MMKQWFSVRKKHNQRTRNSFLLFCFDSHFRFVVIVVTPLCRFEANRNQKNNSDDRLICLGIFLRSFRSKQMQGAYIGSVSTVLGTQIKIIFDLSGRPGSN